MRVDRKLGMCVGEFIGTAVGTPLGAREGTCGRVGWSIRGGCGCII